MFIDSLCLQVDKNKVLTACLVYSLNKIDGIYEKNRIKTKKKEDYAFLQSLGFPDDVCKICMEYNRVGQTKKYVREKEGDVLELVENFGGMLMHREDRPAYSVEDAIDLLENKYFAEKENQFLEDFKFFIDVMEQSSKLGIITTLQRKINKIKRSDISAGIRALYDNRDSIENIFLSKSNELFEEQMNYFKLIKIAKSKTEVLMKYNQKMRKKGYNLQEGLLIK